MHGLGKKRFYHMFDRGLISKNIKKQLKYPLMYEELQKARWEENVRKRMYVCMCYWVSCSVEN